MKLLSAFILFILSIPVAYSYVGFGVCNFGKETVPSVVCYGPAVLKQTTINGDMKVAGSLDAENITVGSMTIDGSVNVANSSVNGLTEANGALHADHVNFQKNINVTGSDILLDHSIIHGSINISSSTNTPTLVLQCSSAVTGEVIFEGKAGVIQVTGDSAVQGKITNGAMEFIKKDCTA